MELFEGKKYWTATYERDEQFLTPDITDRFDIIVAGGGMSGLLSSYELARQGYKVLLLEKNRIGEGSTSLNTGLIQYMSDIGLYDLSKKVGESKASEFYEKSAAALDYIEKISKEIYKEIALDTEVKRSRSIFVASEKKDADSLKKEYTIQKKHGFNVSLFNKDELETKYGLIGEKGLETTGDLEINPYKFVMGVAKTSVKKYGLEIWEGAELKSYKEYKSKDKTFLKVRIVARKISENGSNSFPIEVNMTVPKLILATGYNLLPSIKKEIKKSKLVKTFVGVTQKLKSGIFEKVRYAMMWESKTPYNYFRKSAEDRLVIGGRDVSTLKMDEKIRKKQVEILIEKIEKCAPYLGNNLKTPFSYSAIFGESTDEIPFIGPSEKFSNVFVTAGFGGNGTVYAAMAAKMASDYFIKKIYDKKSITRIGR